jgi:hypothetical protein
MPLNRSSGARAAQTNRPVSGSLVRRPYLSPFTEICEKPDQVTFRVLHEELVHPALDRPGAIPFLLWLHEQWPARTRECCQDRFDRWDTNLKVDASTEGTFQRSCHPIAGLADFVQHDLSAIEVEIRKTLVRPVEEHREPTHVVLEPQALADIDHEQFGNRSCPGDSSIIAVKLIVAPYTGLPERYRSTLPPPAEGDNVVSRVPRDARWNDQRDAREFSIILGPHEGTVRVPAGLPRSP